MNTTPPTTGTARDVLDFIDGVLALLRWDHFHPPVWSAARRCGRWTKRVPVRWNDA